jgi:hypothetical protein
MDNLSIYIELENDQTKLWHVGTVALHQNFWRVLVFTTF